MLAAKEPVFRNSLYALAACLTASCLAACLPPPPLLLMLMLMLMLLLLPVCPPTHTPPPPPPLACSQSVKSVPCRSRRGSTPCFVGGGVRVCVCALDGSRLRHVLVLLPRRRFSRQLPPSSPPPPPAPENRPLKKGCQYASAGWLAVSLCRHPREQNSAPLCCTDATAAAEVAAGSSAPGPDTDPTGMVTLAGPDHDAASASRSQPRPSPVATTTGH